MRHETTLKSLKKLSRPKLIFSVILLIAIIFEALIRFFLAELFCRILNSIPSWSMENFWQYSAILITILVLGTLSTYLIAVFKEKVIQHSCKKLQDKLRNSITQGNYREIEKKQYGDYHTLMTSDTEKLASLYPSIIFPMIGGGVQFISAVYFVFSRSWELALIILALSTASFIVPKLFKIDLKKAQSITQEKDGKLRNFFTHSTSRVALIKTYESENLEAKALGKAYSEYGKARINMQRAFAKFLTITNFTSFIAIAVRAFTSILYISMGKLTIGAFNGISELSSSFSWPFWWMPHLISSMSQSKVSGTRLAEFIDSIAHKKNEKIHIRNNGAILYGENLHFSYDGEKLFEDFSFELKPKEIVGLKWKSGEGKSTLIKLIQGFYIPQNGKIIHGKENLSFAYASQKESFFSDTISNNVSLSINAKHDKYKEALRKSAVDFTEKEEINDDTILWKNGQPLSGGQQKRINLARAFYHDSDVLILDEPTSSLDSKTKVQVLNTIKEEKKKRSVILITHDPETFAICDRFIEK